MPKATPKPGPAKATSRRSPRAAAAAAPAASNLPSRKWWAHLVAALAGLAVAVVQAGGFDTATEITGIGIISAALIAYILPNG